MAISIGKFNISLEDIYEKTSDINILNYYFNITTIPCVIQSPLRKDNNPSFGFYSKDGIKIYWIDFANKDKGGIIDLLEKYWGLSFNNVLNRIWEDIPKFTNINNCNKLIKHSNYYINTCSDLQCKIREWRDYDIKYWKSYGISLKWLKYAEVYPISHKIIIKNNNKYVFTSDKYAYVYVEHKEGKVTLKIYQPFNKSGYKWNNKHDKSVISLWTKVPEYGDKICICSSLKDALCLWANTGIPAIAIQGEGYNMSDTAISELKRRYKEIYILLDNDEAGLKDGLSLSESTGFTNLVLPQFDDEGKDISDAFKILGKEKWLELIVPLFNSSRPQEDWDDLPFKV